MSTSTSRPSHMQPSFKSLNLASSRGDLETFISIVNSMQPEASIHYLRSFLSPAAKGNHLNVVRYLLEKGVKINAEPIAAVAAGCSTDMLELFMDYGWQVNDASQTGDVALPHAVNDESMVRWLLDKGADPNLGPPRYPKLQWPEMNPPCRNSGNALDYAISRAHIRVLDLLLERGAKMENSHGPLYTAVSNAYADVDGSMDMMQHLLDLGADVDQLCYIPSGAFPAKETALGLALRRRKHEKALFLLQNGADPTKKAPGGKSAMEMAQINRQMDFVELFERYM